MRHPVLTLAATLATAMAAVAWALTASTATPTTQGTDRSGTYLTITGRSDGSAVAKVGTTRVANHPRPIAADVNPTRVPGWRPAYGEWRQVPARLIGHRVDAVGSGSFRVGRHALWHVGLTTYVITRGGRVGTS